MANIIIIIIIIIIIVKTNIAIYSQNQYKQYIVKTNISNIVKLSNIARLLYLMKH